MKFHLFPLLLATSLLPFSLTGQDSGATVGGIVFEDVNGNTDFDAADEPVEGVLISLVHLPDERVAGQTYSGEDGRFSFGAVAPGEYHMIVKYVSGLEIATVPFQVSDDDLFFEIPVITRATLPRFTGLYLVNPANTRGPLVSPFAPFEIFRPVDFGKE